MSASTLEGARSLVPLARTPLNMLRARIAEHEFALRKLREKAQVAERWEFEDQIWNALKPKP